MQKNHVQVICNVQREHGKICNKKQKLYCTLQYTKIKLSGVATSYRLNAKEKCAVQEKKASLTRLWKCNM